MDRISVLCLQKAFAEAAIVTVMTRCHGRGDWCAGRMCGYPGGLPRCRLRRMCCGLRMSAHGRRSHPPCRQGSMGLGKDLPTKQPQLQPAMMVASSIGSGARFVDRRPQHQHQHGNMKRNRDAERDTATNRFVQSLAPNLEMVVAPRQSRFSLDATLAPGASTAHANAPAAAWTS